MKTIKGIAMDMRHGYWHCGCGYWKGKPMTGLGRLYYDYWWYYLHVGPFWITVDPY